MPELPDQLQRLLEKEENEVLRDAENLKQALHKLRFEGRQCLAKNLAKSGSALVILKERLFIHMEDEERDLFPFLLTRIPRLEPAKHLFLAEHREFRKKTKKLGTLLRRLKSHPADMGAPMQQIYSEGIYLVCLILSHVKMERRELFKAVKGELTPDEMDQLICLFS